MLSAFGKTFVWGLATAALVVGFVICLYYFYRPVYPEDGAEIDIVHTSLTGPQISEYDRDSSEGEARQADFRQRVEDDVRAGRPLVVHLIVALCDNKHQGIVPVPQHLGNGQDPRNNLYWGAMYGARTFLAQRASWRMVAETLDRQPEVLEKLVFHTTVQRWGREADVYLVAEAWDGAEIESATERFMWLAAGYKSETVRLETLNGFEDLQAGGAAHLVAYVGHNGLMDFSLTNLPSEPSSARRPSAIVLACRSKPYFLELLRQAGAHSLLLTTGLMAPEAYTLDAAVKSWACGDEPQQVRDSAAAAYHKYQKCGLGAARRLFFFEPYPAQ